MDIKDFILETISNIINDAEKLRYWAEVFQEICKEKYEVDIYYKNLIYENVKEILEELFLYKSDLEWLVFYDIDIKEIITYIEVTKMAEDFVPIIKEKYKNEIIDGTICLSLYGVVYKIEENMAILIMILKNNGLI